MQVKMEVCNFLPMRHCDSDRRDATAGIVANEGLTVALQTAVDVVARRNVFFSNKNSIS